MQHLSTLLGVVLICTSVAAVAAEPDCGEFLQNGVTAHRGDSAEFPENTLPAFAGAIAAGADWIELDLYRTRDGQLVVIHDATTNRTGDKQLSVPEATYEELLTVDVATDFRKRKGLSKAECPPQQIPLLKDVLQLAMRQTRTRVSIQPKMDCVADAVELIRSLHAECWVGFNDGQLELMKNVKSLAPELPVFWDRSASADVAHDLPIAKAAGFNALVLNEKAVNARNVQLIQQAGLIPGAWTVNRPQQMQEFLQLGVERIYTDNPRALLQVQKTTFRPVRCPGDYKYHLQGICVSEDAIFWSFTTQLIKTDLSGTILKSIPVAWHHGDLCYQNGQIFVAVNLGKFNDPQGNADSWVFVYNADDLAFVGKHAVQEAFHGAGGIGIRDNHFYVVGGLPENIEENYVYEYDADFRFLEKHVIESGHTHLGIQTAAFAADRWWFGCYGDPKILLVTDADFRMIGRSEFDASLGIVGVPSGELLVASGRCRAKVGCSAGVRLLKVDDIPGARPAQNADKSPQKSSSSEK